jgi:hypothetical protein
MGGRVLIESCQRDPNQYCKVLVVLGISIISFASSTSRVLLVLLVVLLVVLVVGGLWLGE